MVTYVEGRDQRGRRRALNVRYFDSCRRGHQARGAVAIALVAATLFMALLVALVVLDDQSVLLLLAYVVLSALTLFVYGFDKDAAEQGEWRTSESTLARHGGDRWVAGRVARPPALLRHKTTKQPFTTIFWLTVVANLAALAWFVYAAPVTLPL